MRRTICQADVHIPRVINFHPHHWVWRMRKYMMQSIMNVLRWKLRSPWQCWYCLTLTDHQRWVGHHPQPRGDMSQSLNNHWSKQEPWYSISNSVCQSALSSNLNSGDCLRNALFWQLLFYHKANSANAWWIACLGGDLHWLKMPVLTGERESSGNNSNLQATHYLHPPSLLHSLQYFERMRKGVTSFIQIGRRK